MSTPTGSNIKSQRMKLGYSQTELARAIKTTPQQVSRWESGKVEPGLEWILKICATLAIDERDITGAATASSIATHDTGARGYPASPEMMEIERECADLSLDELLQVRLLVRKWKREQRSAAE